MAKHKNNKVKRNLPWRWIVVKLLIVCTVLIGAYMLYLDAQVRKSFANNQWQVPAQIYARPLTFHVKQEISKKEIIDELQLLGYRKVSQTTASGEYSDFAGRLIIMRRAFAFPDEKAQLTKISISWKGNRISSIIDVERQQALNTARLEPWLVTRLVSSNHEDRMLLNIQQVPPVLVKALTLVEDRDFYHHHGVAPLSIFRALVANISAGRTVQGGSTLTQQLVKNLYLTKARSLTRKVKEALMAIIIDARYSKSRILEAYLNEVFLAQNGEMAVHGFGLASYYYFGRPVNELDVSDVAMLVALVKGPSYYNPKRHSERAIERRNLVLRILFEANEIGKGQYEVAVNKPLNLSKNGGIATGEHPAFMDKVRREIRSILAAPDIRESGVKVFTTLDVNAQRRAEKSLTHTLNSLQKNKTVPLDGAIVVSDISSGEIRAIVGGKNAQYKGFNRALDAKRAIGSLVKPAVFLTALASPLDFNLASPLVDKPIVLNTPDGKTWSPQNFDKTYAGQVSLIDALVKSLNVPTVNLGMLVGVENVAQTIRLLGVKTGINEVPSLLLGAIELSPLETNQMYQTIANAGQYVPLHAVSAIVSNKDQLIWHRASFSEQRVDEGAAYLVNYALYKVNEEGTGKRAGASFNGINLAGKTGTTNDYRDSWYTGFDRNELVTIWIGNDENRPVGLTGSSGALSAFIDFEKQQSPKSLSRRFPQNLGIAHFDKESGAVLKAGCQNSVSLPAILDSLSPAQNCAIDKKNKPSNQKQPQKSWWQRIFG